MRAKSPSPEALARANHRLDGLLGEAREALRALELARATEIYDLVEIMGEAVGETRLLAEGAQGIGMVHLLRGELLDAERAFVRARPWMHDPLQIDELDSRLAFTRYERGELDEADRTFATQAQPSVGVRRHRLLGYRGNVARARGEYADALAHYHAASAALAELGERTYRVTFEMDASVVHLLQGDALAALRRLEQLEQQGPPVPLLRVLIGHYRELARAGLGMPERDVPSTSLPLEWPLARIREIARGSADAALAELTGNGPISSHVSLSLQIVQRQRGVLVRAAGRTLIVAADGSFFGLGALRKSLLQQSPAARLLLALTRARQRRPGVFLEGARLVEQVWPNEPLLPSAAKNRLHVTLAALRKAGLREVLESAAGGYRIARDVEVAVVA